MQNKKPSVTDQLIVVGLDRDYTEEEKKAIEQELFGEDWAEHERLKAEGKLDEVEVPEGYEEELEPCDESMIEEEPDSPETEGPLSNN